MYIVIMHESENNFTTPTAAIHLSYIYSIGINTNTLLSLILPTAAEVLSALSFLSSHTVGKVPAHNMGAATELWRCEA